jgi:uncharacterized protein involved in outer membrane biogenesis
MKALKWIGIAVLTLIVLMALFIAFGLNTLRGPISRAVSDATGRELVIEGSVTPIWTWVHPRFRAEGVRFANADWGNAEYLLTADAIEASISVLPLLRGKVVVPEVHLEKPVVALEQDAEGRKNWILEKDPEKKEESRVHVHRLTLDQGQLRYDDAMRDISLESELSTDETGIAFAVSGNYQGNDLIAVGHAGHILSLRDEATAFPIKAQAEAGATRASIDGTVTGLVGLKGLDLKVELSGKSMEELYWIVNVAFPDTKPYTTSGRLVRSGSVVKYENFTGKVGNSDLSGTLQIDTGPERPFMQGDVVSKVMDLGDLGVVVGTEQPREEGVLPDKPFDPSRWDSVDADVRIKAGSIQRPKQLPIENLSTRIQMKDRILSLNPLEFGIAGGKLSGPVRLDGTGETIRADMRMRVQGLQFARMFPTLKENRGSAGDLSGLIELNGTGNTVGRMLSSANGKIGVFMDGGEVSRFLMELVALDLWGVAKVKLKGDEKIEVRCAIADFAVEKGLMQTNAFVFDTSVVKVEGAGVINLQSEEMNLRLDPKPKHGSIASLNSPLFVRGTFGEPKVAPEWGKLTAKGAGAIVMGIINPLLSVLPLLKEGKGEESNCAQLIAEATTKTKQAAKPSKGSAATGATKR